MIIRKVALYLRKSREDESLEETLARHERMLTDYCKRNNLIIEKIYREVVTGENLDIRPQARQMLEDVADGLYDGVVVVELERLSRGNQIDQVEITETFKTSKTLIYTLNKVYDLSTEDGFDEEFFEFGLFMSRREYKTIKRRLARGKKQAQKEGYYIGSALPYGFGKIRGDKGNILVPNEETPLVQMIFNKFVYENYSLADLRSYLREKGIKPRNTNEWNSVVLKNILKNKCYLGYINYNCRSKRTVEVYQGRHEPIIDEETFEKAQQKLAQASHKLNKKNKLSNSLASLVKCSLCGSTMQKHDNYLRCLTPKCPTVLSYFDLVEKQIIEELYNELKEFNYFVENYGEEIEKKQQSKEVEISILQKELSKKDIMLNKACEMLEIGVYSKEKYIERTNTLESEKVAIMEQIKALNNTSNDELVKIKKAIPILEKCIANYWTLNCEQRNELLKSFIERIEYSKTIRNNKWNNSLSDMQLKIFLTF